MNKAAAVDALSAGMGKLKGLTAPSNRKRKKKQQQVGNNSSHLEVEIDFDGPVTPVNGQQQEDQEQEDQGQGQSTVVESSSPTTGAWQYNRPKICRQISVMHGYKWLINSPRIVQDAAVVACLNHQ